WALVGSARSGAPWAKENNATRPAVANEPGTWNLEPGTWNLSEEEWTINRIVLVLENPAMGWDIEDEDEDEWINVLNVASRHDPLDYVPVIVGEPEITAVVTIGQLFVIETEQVQDRRVQVVDVNLVIHRARAELVGCAVDRAALDATPGE